MDDRFISGIGVLTAQRRTLLERALSSYIENSRKGRELEYVVFDDSKDICGRVASFDIARALARRYKVPIRFSGREQREAFARRLMDFHGISGEVLANALLNPEGYTAGQNRNAMLLDSAGSLILCVDDDTVCSPVAPPEPERGLAFSIGADPADFWCYRDFDEACARASFVDVDLVAAHEQLLGTLIESGSVRPARSVVRVTFNGLLGDCAWGAPFGLWHVPMGYLGFCAGSLDRLARSDEHYSAAVQSRQILRITRSPVLSDASFSMLTFCGLDNRDLLPPNVPVRRGQDLVFGQMVWKCLTNSVFGHLPLALVHDPSPSRRFWPGEVTRAASGVDTCRIILEVIARFEPGCSDASTSNRLELLGQNLVSLADLPLHTLRTTLMDWLVDSNRRFEVELRERARRVSGTSAQCASDINRFCEKLEAAENRDDYWLPLDLRGTEGLAAAEGRTRSVLGSFGALLLQWPRIVEAAKSLRAGGVRVSVDVAEARSERVAG